MADLIAVMRKMVQDIIDNPIRGAQASIQNGQVNIFFGFSEAELRETYGECESCDKPKCWCRCVSHTGNAHESENQDNG